MTKILEFYKCNTCGNIAMITHTGDGELVCCGTAMEKLTEKTAEEGLSEKHVPVVEKTGTGIRVRVGSVEHPMQKEHYIQWISVKQGRDFHIHALRPGEKPVAEFPAGDAEPKSLIYCNVHGLWTNRP